MRIQFTTVKIYSTIRSTLGGDANKRKVNSREDKNCVQGLTKTLHKKTLHNFVVSVLKESDYLCLEHFWMHSVHQMQSKHQPVSLNSKKIDLVKIMSDIKLW